jgi:hypothetical protein
MPVDLNNLPDDILSYRNNCLYKFIEENFGTDEMMLIKMQSINNISTLITVPDIMAFLNFNCKEIIELKNRICFIDDDNNQFMVKAGIQTNINNLISALKEKRKKQMKRIKPSKTSSQSSTQLDSDQSNTPSLNISNLTSTDSQLTPAIATTPKIHSLDDYTQKITDSIEKFCVNSFENINLTNTVDYKIHLNILDTNINGFIKCGCNTNIKIGFRSKPNSFQISAYLKHLKNSRCSMIKKKKQGLNNISNVNNKLSNFVLQNDDNSKTNSTENVSDDENLDVDDSFSTTTNNSITTVTNCSKNKRPLPLQSTSSITKKTKSS